MKYSAANKNNDTDLPLVTQKYVCNQSKVNSSRLKIVGMITQLCASVSTPGTVRQVECVLLRVNYTACRTLFTEGSSVCVCACACACAHIRKALGPVVTVSISVIIASDFYLFCFSLFALLSF